MDMSWQAMLHDAAAVSFERNAESLATENRTRSYVDLSHAQIQVLSEKILSLPHEGIVLLLSRFCFHLSPEETEKFFQLKNAKGRFRFYQELLSSCMGVNADTDDKTVGNNRTHIVFRKVWKTVAVAAITLTLLFSTAMVANAQFRERVVSWVIETFEKYGIFELHGDELDEPQDLTEYQAGYLPDGAILQDTTKQPNKEPEVVIHRYTIGESKDFEILITQSNNRVYFDTENAEIEPLEKDGLTGYFFKKDDMTYICFERDGCFFSVYGTADADELLKVAAGITKK